MCAMKYVFLFTYEIEKESELECVTAYLSIFQGCYIEKTTNKIPFLLKWTQATSSWGNGHTRYPIFRILNNYSWKLFYRIFDFNDGITVTFLIREVTLRLLENIHSIYKTYHTNIIRCLLSIIILLELMVCN